MSVPKTEGKSFLFHIGNEFPNTISITSEFGFYVKVFSFGISILISVRYFWSFFFDSYAIVYINFGIT